MTPGNETWRTEFARTVARRRAEADHFQRQHEERKDRERNADRADDAVTELAAVAVMATEAQLAEFRIELDQYDAAVVEALDENTRELEKVRAELDEMLSRAYVLDDGRRVFKMDDGITVIDEFGEELSPDVIDPDAIEDWRPGGNRFLDRFHAERDLVQRREELLDLQKDLDEARDLADEGDLTADELSELRERLASQTALTVGSKLPGYEAPEHADARSEFSQAAADPSLSRSGPILDAPVFAQ